MRNRDIILKLKDLTIAEVLEREITTFGSGSHVIVPQKHGGKKAIVIILKD